MTSNTLLKPRKKAPSGPRIGFGCFSSIAQSAGVSDSALKADSSTEMAMVSANCLYMLPTSPPSRATGTNTAREDERDPDDRRRDLLHRLDGRLLRAHAVLEVVDDRLDHDDGVVHHDADGEHQAEHRQRVDRESQEREEDERADRATPGSSAAG